MTTAGFRAFLRHPDFAFFCVVLLPPHEFGLLRAALAVPVLSLR